MAPVIKVSELIAALQAMPPESLCFFSDGENYRPINGGARIKLYECNDWWFDEGQRVDENDKLVEAVLLQ